MEVVHSRDWLDDDSCQPADDISMKPRECSKAGVGHVCYKCCQFESQSKGRSVPNLNVRPQNGAVTLQRMRDRPDGRDSPQGSEGGKSVSENMCARHIDRHVDFYCPKHRVAICGVCAYMDHTHCNAGYVPDLSLDYRDGQEFKDITKMLAALDKKAGQCLTDASMSLGLVKDSTERAVQEIQTFRAEIDAYLDRKETEVLMLAKKLFKENEKLVTKQIYNCKQIKCKVTEMKTQLQGQDIKDADLYMCAKDAHAEAERLKVKLDRYMTQTKPATCYFKREGRLEKELLSQRGLGVLQVARDTRITKEIDPRDLCETDRIMPNISKRIDINVKVKGNKDCKITGATVLSPHALLLVDKNNKCVKYVDTSIFAIVAWQIFTSYPCDVTALDCMSAAVTFPACKQIQILAACKGLSHVRTIDVSGECQGIASTGDILIVTYTNPPKVELMDYYGLVHQIFQNDDKGKPIFQCPSYVAIASDIHLRDDVVFYVSDTKSNAVLKMSTSGHVLGKYGGVPEPNGLAASPDGGFVVCHRHRQEIVSVSSSGKIQKLLDSADDLQYPMIVCYCPVQHFFYVSNYRPFENDDTDNIVSVFSAADMTRDVKNTDCGFGTWS